MAQAIGILSKSAALLESLIGNHAFLDGNKRTAIAAAALFLRLNGCRLTANNQQLETFTLQCAQHLLSLDQIVRWFETWSQKI
jgi:death-on-curing protein